MKEKQPTLHTTKYMKTQNAIIFYMLIFNLNIYTYGCFLRSNDL